MSRRAALRALPVVGSTSTRTPRSRAEILRDRAATSRRLAELDDELAELEHDRGPDLIDVLSSIPGSRRSLLSACRSGEISGAVKIARRWLASRTAIDAYLRARGPRLVERDDADEDDLEGVRRALSAGRGHR